MATTTRVSCGRPSTSRLLRIAAAVSAAPVPGTRRRPRMGARDGAVGNHLIIGMLIIGIRRPDRTGAIPQDGDAAARRPAVLAVDLQAMPRAALPRARVSWPSH